MLNCLYSQFWVFLLCFTIETLCNSSPDKLLLYKCTLKMSISFSLLHKLLLSTTTQRASKWTRTRLFRPSSSTFVTSTIIVFFCQFTQILNYQIWPNPRTTISLYPNQHRPPWPVGSQSVGRVIQKFNWGYHSLTVHIPFSPPHDHQSVNPGRHCQTWLKYLAYALFAIGLQ